METKYNNAPNLTFSNCYFFFSSFKGSLSKRRGPWGGPCCYQRLGPSVPTLFVHFLQTAVILSEVNKGKALLYLVSVYSCNSSLYYNSTRSCIICNFPWCPRRDIMRLYLLVRLRNPVFLSYTANRAFSNTGMIRTTPITPRTQYIACEEVRKLSTSLSLFREDWYQWPHELLVNKPTQ